MMDTRNRDASQRHFVARCPRNAVDRAPIERSALYLAPISLLRAGKLSALAVNVNLIGVFPLGSQWSRLPWPVFTRSSNP